MRGSSITTSRRPCCRCAHPRKRRRRSTTSQHLAFRSAAFPAPGFDLHPVAMKGQPLGRVVG